MTEQDIFETEMPAEIPEAFVVDDDMKADWALRKIAEADADLARMETWYSDQLAKAKKQHDERVGFFLSLLGQYFMKVPKKETKTQFKYSLPSGDLVFTKEKQDFKATDPELLLGWCQENAPQLVAVEMKPAWAEIKKRLTMTEAGVVDSESGMIVDGVELVTKPEEFKAKVKGDI